MSMRAQSFLLRLSRFFRHRRGGSMRRKNVRLIVTGFVLLVAAAGFFLYMFGMAPKSNDPRALMETVGQVSGAVGAISIVMIVFGLVGKKV
jgi:hypothetical protein